MTTQGGRDKCLEMVEEGLLDKDSLILMFVKWTTADDIEAMLDANEVSLWPDGRWNDDEQEEDNDPEDD